MFLFYFLCWWQRKKKHWPIIDCRSCESDLKLFLNLFCFEADSRMWAGEDRERDGAHQWAGSHCYVWDGIGPWTHHSGWMHSFHWIALFEGLVQIQPGNVFFFFFFFLQSLQTDVYDHYSAIYSLLADRLKKHKTLPVVLPTPRPISYPVNAVQVWHFCWKIPCLPFGVVTLEFWIMVCEVAIFYSLDFYKCILKRIAFT